MADMLTPAQIAALPPVAPGHARHILKKPVAGIGDDGEPTILTHVDLRMDVTGADMVATDRAPGPIGKQLHLLAALSGQPFSVITRMSQPDIDALMELEADPTPPGHRTGNAPSG
jgi:hypothetical protein